MREVSQNNHNLPKEEAFDKNFWELEITKKLLKRKEYLLRNQSLELMCGKITNSLQSISHWKKYYTNLMNKMDTKLSKDIIKSRFDYPRVSECFRVC